MMADVTALSHLPGVTQKTMAIISTTHLLQFYSNICVLLYVQCSVRHETTQQANSSRVPLQN